MEDVRSRKLSTASQDLIWPPFKIQSLKFEIMRVKMQIASDVASFLLHRRTVAREKSASELHLRMEAVRSGKLSTASNDLIWPSFNIQSLKFEIMRVKMQIASDVATFR
ncbi:hypothetical protein CEXT_419511 [Caerostris extrusa]|uniref:Uncharacterized protein n=1 Tax=Caerostris extrusa TaxID=172846 RepID=A0AAV4NAH0_CAEEX|nr:hypothetical protein CEXT_419511 [Caerostris extrusa]